MEAIIKQWIEISLGELFNSNDIQLIDRKLKEECINHRLAFYLERNKPNIYSAYYVDLEYNKNNRDEKSIQFQGAKKFIRPDIIIHLRNDDITDNLIAFECKKLHLNSNDKAKLKGLLGNGYNYKVCLGISYQPNRNYFLVYESNRGFNKPRQIWKNQCQL